MNCALLLTVAAFPSSVVLLVAKPRLWLPAYLLLLPIAPQVALAGVPVSASSLVLVGGMTSILLHKLLRRDLTVGAFPPMTATLAFLVSVFFSSINAGLIWGDDLGDLSLMKWARLVESFLPFILLAATYRVVDDSFVRRAVNTILLAGTLGAALGILSCVFPDAFYTLYSIDRYRGFQFACLWRAVGVFLDPNHLSSFLAIVLVLAAATATDRALAINRLLLGAAVAVCLPAMLLTFSRAGWLNLLAAGLTFLAVARRIQFARRVRVAAVVVLSLLVVVGVLARFHPELSSSLWRRVALTITYLTSGEIDRAFSGRISVWEGVAEAFAAHPTFGIGYKMLPEKVVMADNNYLCFLAEGGIAGALVWLLWLVSVTVAAARAARRHSLGACVLAAWVGMLANMMSADVMTYWRTVGLFMSILGLVLIASHRRGGNRAPEAGCEQPSNPRRSPERPEILG